MIKFMDILIEQPFHIIIGEYLHINDNKKLMNLNKEIFNNKISKIYFKKMVIEKSKKIIYKFMKKYVSYIKFVNNFYSYILEFHYDIIHNLITKRMNAIYFFRNYEKIYINDWYNSFIGWKKDLIDKYKSDEDLNRKTATRYDLYKLLRRMNVDEVYSIGW